MDDLLNNAPCGFLSFADDGAITLANATLSQWLGYEPQELMGRPIDTILSVGGRIFYQTHLSPLLKMQGKAEEIYFSLKTRQGESLAVLTNAVRYERNGAFVSDCAFLPMRRRREYEDELLQAKKMADEASEAKAKFLSMMSHELRTPLNAILGFGQLLEMDELETFQSESVQHILKAGKHLLDLINEVLDISRIEAGQLEVSLQPVLSSEVMQEAFEMARPIVARAGIEMMMQSVADNQSWVLADRGRLRQVLLNLLANAVKYNREGGRVTLSCERSPDNNDGKLERIRFVVLDTGLGIPSEDLSRLFVPFERLAAEGSEIEGTGLGLALCRRLTRAMGGEIGVQSTLGEGSSFWVELPCASSPDELDAVRVVQAKDDISVQATTPVSHLLYIEDNASNLTLLQSIISYRPNIYPLSATTGEAGLHLAREHRPDLILLDLRLPDMPGDEVLGQLRSHPSTQHIPVVMLGADATPRQVARLLAAGARAYLTKPLDMNRFLEVFDEELAKRKVH